MLGDFIPGSLREVNYNEMFYRAFKKLACCELIFSKEFLQVIARTLNGIRLNLHMFSFPYYLSVTYCSHCG